MIQGIENYIDTSLIGSLYLNSTNSTAENQNVSAEDFDEVYNQVNKTNAKSTSQTLAESATSEESVSDSAPAEKSQASGGGSSDSDSNNPMDLNGDGKVTIDEMMKYLQKKITDNIEEQIKSALEQFSGSSDSSGETNTHSFNLKNAINAYQTGQNLISSIIK